MALIFEDRGQEFSEKFYELGNGYGYCNYALLDITKRTWQSVVPSMIMTNLASLALDDFCNSKEPAIFNRLAQSNLPFIWQEAETVVYLNNSTEVDFSELGGFEIFLQANDLRYGCCIPAYHPSGTRAAILYFGKNLETKRPFSSMMNDATKLFEDYANSLLFSDAHNHHLLTERELEFLQLLAEGKTSSEIANNFLLSEHTINHYIKTASKHLNATNPLHAVVKAIKRNLIQM